MKFFLFSFLGFYFLTSGNMALASSTATPFTPADLKAAASKTNKIIFYFVSRGMPLSEKGIADIEAAAKDRGYSVSVLNDPDLPIEANGQPTYPVIARDSYFDQLGVTLHYPSFLLFKNGSQCGHSIPGYKHKAGYLKWIDTLESTCGAPVTANGLEDVHPLSHTLHPVVIRQTTTPRIIGGFFRVVNDEWVTYYDNNSNTGHNYLFNRSTGEEITLPQSYDAFPSADQEMILMPSPIAFYSFWDFLNDPSNAVNARPILVDTTDNEDYQSVSVMHRHIGKVYRVVTSDESTSIQYRDYLSKDHGHSLSPLAPIQALCPQINNSTPQIAKFGGTKVSFASYANFVFKTSIYDIGRDADRCDSLGDIGNSVQTSKATFSRDGKAVAYHAYGGSAVGVNVYYEDLTTHEITKLNEAGSPGVVTTPDFPDFLPNGHILYRRLTFDPSVPPGQQESALIEVELR